MLSLLGIAVALLAPTDAATFKRLNNRRLVEKVSVVDGELVRGVIEDGPYGGNGGSAWTDGGAVHLNGLPTAVDVRSGDRLDALRVKYGEVYGEWHGGGGGSPHSCQFNPGDEIFIVQGRHGSRIDEIEFVTVGGTVCGPYGGGGGSPFVSAHPGCVLEYLSGNAGSGIDSLTIHWSCP